MKLDVLNGYVLAVMTVFVMLFYLFVVVTGLRDLIRRLPDYVSRARRSQSGGTPPGSRKAKRSR